MPVILNTHYLNLETNKKQSFKIVVSSRESSKLGCKDQLELNLYQNQKTSVLYQKNLNIQTSKSPLQKNKSLKSIQLSPSKISQKSGRQKNRDLSKRLFQKAKIIEDPKVETYLGVNSYKKNNPEIRKVKSTSHLPTIQKEKNDNNCKTLQGFSSKNIDLNENKMFKILSKVSQEFAYFQDNSGSFEQYLVKPLKKQMIDTIKQRNSANFNKLSQSDRHFLNNLHEGLAIKKTQEADCISQNSSNTPKLSQNSSNTPKSLKKSVMLSSLSKLILQQQIAGQQNSNILQYSKQSNLFE